MTAIPNGVARRNATVVRGGDGTPLAYWRGGDGPPLLLVHGAAADHGRWAPVLPALAVRFAVCALDRRGRGASGDADTYAAAHEFADVAAVADALAAAHGAPVDVLGHSYGALCALEAARRTASVRRLVLYEPPLRATGEPVVPPGVVARLEALLAAGDRDGVVATTMREVAGLSAEAVARLQGLPAWPARIAAAHTIPRELRATEAYRFAPERFRRVTAPTLLLLGGASPAAFGAATAALAGALPDARVVVLPGQGHAAMDTGTDRFAAEVLRFLAAG